MNIHDCYGKSPLSLAVWWRQPECIRIFLQAGAHRSSSLTHYRQSMMETLKEIEDDLEKEIDNQTKPGDRINTELNLKKMCSDMIRKRLLDVQPPTNLLHKVPKLSKVFLISA